MVFSLVMEPIQSSRAKDGQQDLPGTAQDKRVLTYKIHE